MASFDGDCGRDELAPPIPPLSRSIPSPPPSSSSRTIITSSSPSIAGAVFVASAPSRAPPSTRRSRRSGWRGRRARSFPRLRRWKPTSTPAGVSGRERASRESQTRWVFVSSLPRVGPKRRAPSRFPTPPPRARRVRRAPPPPRPPRSLGSPPRLRVRRCRRRSIVPARATPAALAGRGAPSFRAVSSARIDRFVSQRRLRLGARRVDEAASTIPSRLRGDV